MNNKKTCMWKLVCAAMAFEYETECGQEIAYHFDVYEEDSPIKYCQFCGGEITEQ